MFVGFWKLYARYARTSGQFQPQIQGIGVNNFGIRESMWHLEFYFCPGA